MASVPTDHIYLVGPGIWPGRYIFLWPGRILFGPAIYALIVTGRSVAENKIYKRKGGESNEFRSYWFHGYNDGMGRNNV